MFLLISNCQFFRLFINIFMTRTGISRVRTVLIICLFSVKDDLRFSYAVLLILIFNVILSSTFSPEAF